MTEVERAYRNAYIGAGDLVVLCEGDVLGYESILLRRWLEAQGLAGPVDITPCGTKSSVYGFADAVGRSRSVVAVEDRDFRTPDEAAAYCRGRMGDRNERGCNVVAWRFWERNEIENYLLEPQVLLPVMAEHFACTPEAVQQALDEALQALVVYQCVEQTAVRAERIHEELADQLRRLLRDVGRRPSWSKSGTELVAPDGAEVAQRLSENAEKWVGAEAQLVPGVRAEVSAFDELLSGGVPEDWLTEWAGKEVLKYLRMLLAARHGWMDGGARRVVDWGEVGGRTKQDELDRQIERSVSKPITDACVSWLSQAQESPAHAEWRALTEVVRSALG